MKNCENNYWKVGKGRWINLRLTLSPFSGSSVLRTAGEEEVMAGNMAKEKEK
jgi:hypothetical protein